LEVIFYDLFHSIMMVVVVSHVAFQSSFVEKFDCIYLFLCFCPYNENIQVMKWLSSYTITLTYHLCSCHSAAATSFSSSTSVSLLKIILLSSLALLCYHERTLLVWSYFKRTHFQKSQLTILKMTDRVGADLQDSTTAAVYTKCPDHEEIDGDNRDNKSDHTNK